jgi:hypothetical protein
VTVLSESLASCATRTSPLRPGRRLRAGPGQAARPALPPAGASLGKGGRAAGAERARPRSGVRPTEAAPLRGHGGSPAPALQSPPRRRLLHGRKRHPPPAGQKSFVPTLRAPKARKTVTKQTASERAAEFLFNKPRIPVAIRLARLIQKCLEVLLNHPVQDHFLPLKGTRRARGGDRCPPMGTRPPQGARPAAGRKRHRASVHR